LDFILGLSDISSPSTYRFIYYCY